MDSYYFFTVLFLFFTTNHRSYFAVAINNFTVSGVLKYGFLNVTNANSTFGGNFTNSSDSNINFTANVSNPSVPRNKQQNSDTNKVQLSPKFIIFLIFAGLCVLLNVRVYQILAVKSEQKSRPANILVAHLTLVAIGSLVLIFHKLLTKVNLINFDAPGFCNFIAFFRSCIQSIFSLNIAANIWVRRRNDAIDLERSFAYHVMRVMWRITMISNLPTIFMVKYYESPDTQLGKCREVHLFGSPIATIMYESLRLFLFNVMVCAYLIKTSFVMWRSRRYIRNLRGTGTTKLLKQIRLVYLHTFILTLVWFPNGVCIFLHKILIRFDWAPDYMKYVTNPPYMNHFVPSIRINCLPHSTIILDNNVQDESGVFGWKANIVPGRQSSKSKKEKSVTWSKKAGVRIIENPNNLEHIETSLSTTVGITEAVGSFCNSMARMIPLQFPIIVTCPPIPTALTPSTSQRLQNFVVQVYVESEPDSPDSEIEMLISKFKSETLV